jgi:hypothetical protein
LAIFFAAAKSNGIRNPLWLDWVYCGSCYRHAA